MLSLLFALSLDAHAASRIVFRTGSPVLFFVDGDQVAYNSKLKPTADQLSAGMHTIEVKSLIGRSLYVGELDLPADTEVEAIWSARDLEIVDSRPVDGAVAEPIDEAVPVEELPVDEPEPETLPPVEIAADPLAAVATEGETLDEETLLAYAEEPTHKVMTEPEPPAEAVEAAPLAIAVAAPPEPVQAEPVPAVEPVAPEPVAPVPAAVAAAPVASRVEQVRAAHHDIPAEAVVEPAIILGSQVGGPVEPEPEAGLLTDPSTIALTVPDGEGLRLALESQGTQFELHVSQDMFALVDAEGATRITFPLSALAPDPGSLRVGVAGVRQAGVWIDGRLEGVLRPGGSELDMSLDPGEHTIIVRDADTGELLEERTVTIQPGTELSLEVGASARVGSL